MSGTADRGSGLLPPDPFAVVLGLFYPFHVEQRYLASNSFADNVFLLPLFDENLCILLDSVLGFHWLLVPSSHPLCSALMANASFGSLEESVEEVENFSLDDFSLHISPDSAAALKTIESSLVGRLFSRKPLSTGTLRKVLSGMWRLQSGWKFQEVDRKTKTFVFRLSSPAEVKRILNNGPWSPCDGFLMVSAMPEDGVWASADLSSLDIWVKALGVPLPFLTDDSAGKMASRLGKCISVDKVRKNGILVRDFLRFRVRINILCPMIPGISLDDGHLEDVCSGRKRVVLVDDGRSVPLFGPWLRDGSKLENGFALLEVGDIHDIKALEKDDSILGGSASAKVGENGGAPSVRKDILPTGMEGVPRQRSDTAFSVAYNDYVDLQFPTQHVERVAEIFQKHLSPVRFGAGCTNDECVGSRSKSTYQLKRPKLIGPKGIQKKPVFRFSNRDLDLQIGNKRKKVSSISDLEPGFTGESTGNDCIAVLDNHRVPDVFGEGSAVIIEADDNSPSETNIVPKIVCLTGGIEVSEVPLSPSRLGGPPVTSGGELVTDSSLLVASAPAVLDGQVKARTVSALRGLVLRENPDVLFLMETKLNLARMDVLWRQMGFFDAIIVEASGASGGLCLCWKAGVVVSRLKAEKNLISVRFDNTLNVPSWIGLFVYGPPVRGDRASFWESLALDITHLSLPWVVLGDLNALLDNGDKVGGNRVYPGDLQFLSDFLFISGGVDLGCVGNFFTWSNKRQHPDLIKERLDRVISAPDWITLFPKAGVSALPIIYSDHAPIVLDLLHDLENYHKPFRFLDAWTSDPSCKTVVQDAWKLAVSGAKSFQLVSRISNTRKMLSKWNREVFGFCKEKLVALEALLLEVQQRNPSPVNLKLEADILLEIEEVSSRQSNIWRQKSRELWLRDGDRNTRFFHASTVIRRKRNFISSVSDDGVFWLRTRQEIGNYFTNNFKEVFSSSHPDIGQDLFELLPPVINDEMNVELTRVPSEEEVRKVVWSMAPLKSPGPDGMPGRFYRAHWSTVGKDVVGTVIEFFRTGEFVKSLNRTFIVLIPKKNGASKFDEFRPISLCNFVYKVIAKLLANRLRVVLPLIISPFQSAFVPGRWIAENSIIAHEILDSFKKKKGRSGFVGLKVDMSKAYDRLEWKFIDKVMEAFGFGDDFRKLVVKSISSVSFSVLLNGGPLRQFSPSRGLRQGDPLSPFLFIICSEVLSRLLIQAEGRGLIHGFKVSPRCPPISHLMYADDTFLFCKAKASEIDTIIQCLLTYGKWSGQLINSAKSSVVFSANTRDDIKDTILSTLGYRPMTLEDKFLGNPVFFSKSMSRDFNFVVEKVKNRLEGWRCKLLSQASRTTLIKSVVSATPLYPMSTFLLPLSLCSELDKLVRKFWWIGCVDKSRYLALTSWDSICKPKEFGGLGIKKFFDLNLSLISKLGWCLARGSDSLWCRVFRAKYCKRGDSFWSLSLPNSASRFARGVLVSRNLIRQETCWLMADGRNIDVWHSPWIPGLTWEEYKAAFNPRIQQPKVVMLSELCSVRGALDPSLLAGWFLPSVCSTILNIEALPGASQDTLVWRDSPDGSFSVKQAYLSLIKPRLGVSNMEWKKIWASPVQERIKLFLWKMKKNILPCGDRLRSVFGNSSVCVFCKGNNDSLSHLFFHCSLARACWFASPYALRNDLLCFGSDSEIVPWIFSSVCCPFLAPNDNDFPQFAAHLCYSIWHARNQLFHQGIVPSPSSIIEKVMAAINDYNRLLERHRFSVDEPLLDPARTAQPVPKVVNFYVDAAVRGDLAFIAVVVLNEERDFLDALSAKVKCASPLEAECWALCHAFSLCLRMNCEDANFFSDCLPLVSAIRGSTIPSWKLTNMFLHLYSCLNFDVNCCVFWIPRKDNSLAHNVAAWAASHNIVGPLGVGDVAPLVATMD
uniref:Reverse transcriptase domain-containing protein n=1 Tax=Cannabis sativa TaxID=3483 RepID=A0A803P0S6_CANSA